MFKIISIFVCIFTTLLDFSQSVSFDCKFKFYNVGADYKCEVQNFVYIISPDAAQIDWINGTHLDGYNNDNVNVFSLSIGQIHYFPRGLDKFFKNLTYISIGRTGLKEIHQIDLKAFPNLLKLSLYDNNLKILEENLFQFNPNLEEINLFFNKIFHIDLNVFDKLTKLKGLDLDLNFCINMNADDNPTEVQNVIKTAKSNCTNSDYLNLEQKVKNLENQSKNLRSENFKEMLEILESEVKSSKFPNFFQDRLQDLKSAQELKAQEEATKALTSPSAATAAAVETTKSISFCLFVVLLCFIAIY